MSTREPGQPVARASGAVRYFVPAYLLVCGLVLFVLAFNLSQSDPDELFVAGLALVGGVTMWLTAALVATLGRRG
jgi:hypothetical protein